MRGLLRKLSSLAVLLPSGPQALSVWQQPANILISGRYYGSASEIGGIEARWGDGAWGTIDAAVSAGTFGGTLAGCAAPTRTLQFRGTKNKAVMRAITIAGVGEVYAIAGQSNAAGSSTNYQDYSHATLLASMLGPGYIGTTWANLREKSPWPLVASEIMADQGVAVGTIPCALGSTTIAQWQPVTGDGLYENLVAKIGAAGGARACLWWQGESDVSAGTAEATYNAGLDTIANSLYAATGVKLVVCKLQNWGNPANLAAINSAIATAWADNANVLQGPDLSDLTPSDGPHFVTDGEMATIAARWWARIEALFY